MLHGNSWKPMTVEAPTLWALFDKLRGVRETLKAAGREPPDWPVDQIVIKRERV